MPHARRLIITADDFGLSDAVNEAVERGWREGVLSSASLMVNGPAAADAVRRARANPGLRVGLHLVLVEGRATLTPAEIPALVGADGWFPADQLRLGLRYFFTPGIRRQLGAEICAQFAAFAATGLALDHANAHKHMHLHPTVAGLMLRIGREFGLRAVRIPAEPPAVLQACGAAPGLGARAMHAWAGVLRAQARRAGMRVNDHLFGNAWSGRMDAGRLRSIAAHLPDGVSEIYLHPATRRDALLRRLMPQYRHEDEFAALRDPAVAEALAGIPRGGFSDLP